MVQPAWNQDANIPLSKEEIEDVLIDLANKFGFQKGESQPSAPLTDGRLFTQRFRLSHDPARLARVPHVT